MTINPKWGMWLSIILALGGALTGLGASFADLGLSPGEVKAVLAGDTIVLTLGNAVNAVLHMIPSQNGPAGAAQFPLGPKP
jgi:phosphosulfolactate phosphohydrolase-like enzyme